MRFDRACGVLLHPTSLPGPHGSGDFGSAAYHFVDWLVTAGQKLWQILPLGGIGPGNSPYMSSSAFAGNVLLIDLAELQARGWLEAAELEPAPGLRRRAGELRHGDALAHGAPAARRDALRRERQRCRRHGLSRRSAAGMPPGSTTTRCSWRSPTATPGSSGATGPAPSPRASRRRCAPPREAHAERIAFRKFCQWRFFEQWLRLKAYANERGIQIVGDAPIFVAYQSAEVWARQALFELDANGHAQVVAGVPPDYFSATGQRWGNPLYRWPAHADEGYAWWIERIRRTFELVDIVRIDHFRGFAALLGDPGQRADRRQGPLGAGPGAALFKAIAKALGPLPIIAEDLGLITPDVTALRKRFAFPGMRILQFAFGGDSRNVYLPHNHEPDSVVYTGTHDNDTTLGWWASASAHERAHALAYLGCDGREMHWDLIRAACASVADTAIIPMQDVLGLGGEHRMNLPGHAEGYWEWRFDWDQVQPGHARRLAALCRLYGR